MNESIGIDYGLGKTNRDVETGIHFGIIPHHTVGQAWYDESEADYGDPVGDDEMAEPICFRYDREGYSAVQDADSPDIFVMKSPYFTRCAYCSPCAPGAGFITDTRVDGIRTYCFGHDWYETEDGKHAAPYPVYSVETGERVEP
jgi:hypothetical protein